MMNKFMKKHHKFLRKLIIVNMVIAILVCLDIILSQNYISITRYVYKSSEIKKGFKVVHLTDLHNYEFGLKNCRLLGKVK